MAAQSFVVDTVASRITVRTRSEGLLARLAHDLEIEGRGVSGRATIDGESWTAELTLPVSALRVTGVLHGSKLDPAALSASERAQIEAKMREDVFFGKVSAIEATARGQSRSSGEATIAIGPRSQRVPVTLSAAGEGAGPIVTTGRFTLSLDALGARPIKGPLGAFRVKDAVEVELAITLAAS